MNLSETIIKIREDNNLTQDEMAEKIFVTRQAISNHSIEKILIRQPEKQPRHNQKTLEIFREKTWQLFCIKQREALGII